MPTVWQGNSVLAPSATAAVASGTQKLAGKAAFITAAQVTTALETLFNMLQALLDQQAVGTDERAHAVMLLLAYHAATVSNDKYSAVKAIKQIERDAMLLLDHAWNVFGVTGLPIHQPTRYQLSEWMTKVASERSSNSLTTLQGPSSY